MKTTQIEAIFVMAGVTIKRKWRLVNQYLGNNDTPAPEHYAAIVENPWWLVETEMGLITVGWRKRVISVDWSATGFKVTEPSKLVDDPAVCTISEDYVHAYDMYDVSKIIKNLHALWDRPASGSTITDEGVTRDGRAYVPWQ